MQTPAETAHAVSAGTRHRLRGRRRVRHVAPDASDRTAQERMSETEGKLDAPGIFRAEAGAEFHLPARPVENHGAFGALWKKVALPM